MVDNIYLRPYDNIDSLTRDLYIESLEAANRKWVDAYQSAFVAVVQTEKDGQRFRDRLSVERISLFTSMIICLTMLMIFVVLLIPVNIVLRLQIIGVCFLVIVVITLACRAWFYHKLRLRLVFAENRRLAYERRWPGLSEYIKLKISVYDFDIPESPDDFIKFEDIDCPKDEPIDDLNIDWEQVKDFDKS